VNLKYSQAIVEILKEENAPINQKTLKKKISAKLDLTDVKIRQLLDAGEEKFWQVKKGPKNSSLYSVFVFVDPNIDQQTNQQNSDRKTYPTNTDRKSATNIVEKQEVDSLTGDIPQTEKRDSAKAQKKVSFVPETLADFAKQGAMRQ
jgi:DNA primase